MRVCVHACARGGETDPKMQIEPPTSHGTPAANELAGLFADVDTYAFVCAHTAHPALLDYPICRFTREAALTVVAKGEYFRNARKGRTIEKRFRGADALQLLADYSRFTNFRLIKGTKRLRTKPHLSPPLVAHFS